MNQNKSWIYSFLRKSILPAWVVPAYPNRGSLSIFPMVSGKCRPQSIGGFSTTIWRVKQLVTLWHCAISFGIPSQIVPRVPHSCEDLVSFSFSTFDGRLSNCQFCNQDHTGTWWNILQHKFESGWMEPIVLLNLSRGPSIWSQRDLTLSKAVLFEPTFLDWSFFGSP